MKTSLATLFVVILFSVSLFAQFSGNALQFDGVNDYVNLGNSSVFNINSAVTYEAWIRPDTSLNGFIFNKWVNFQEDKQLTYSDGRITFFLFNAFSGASLVTASIVPLHQYTHIAATYDGSLAKLYVNGVFDTSKSVGGQVNNSSGNLFIGHNPDRFDVLAPFKGIIDEFRIWNTARTESEIQATMNQSLNGDEPGLIGYWKFDEGTGSTTADETSNGNDGTISGAIWVPGTTPVEENVKSADSYNLSQNYPNPFNPSTTISFQLPISGEVSLRVYDILGNEVATLVNEEKHAGNYQIDFNSEGLSSGVYYYKLQVGGFVETKKMILIK
jgi:hypothetical protein